MYNQPLSDASLIACPHCDLMQRLPEIKPGESARCPRCDKELRRHHANSLRRTLPLTIAAAILYVIANAVPMLGLRAAGREAFTTVFGGAQQLWRDGQEAVAVLVLFTVVIAPALHIGFIMAALIGAYRKRPPKWVGTLLRYRPATGTWSMLEVMVRGVLVSLSKFAV
jgi:paraquat-inducible protein A